MNSSTGLAVQHATRLRDYLVKGPAQQREGDHRGAVAGTVQADGRAHYVYGEITGYYLHWLASLDDTTGLSVEIAQASAAAVSWLGTYLSGTAPPPTRIYLRDAVDDWRNEALFAFDLAMIAGGLARVDHRKLVSLPPTLRADLQRWLQCFTGDEGLKVCLPHAATTVLPQRWSTMGGAFTAKTASRILLLGKQVTLPEPLLAACRRQLQQTAGLAERNGIDMLHPTLYALEGCLLSPDADVERLARWFEQIIALRDSDGSLPESRQTPHIRRSDIIAQALRIAIFLEALLQQHGRYREPAHRFATALRQRIRSDGSLSFSGDDKSAANIWSMMFAEQALRLHEAQVGGQPLPFIADALV